MRRTSCRFVAIVFISGLSLSLCQPLFSHAASFELPALEDIVTLSTAESRFTGDNTLASETTEETGYWGTWLKFDLSSLAGMVVTSSELELTTFFNHSLDAIDHEVHSSSDDSWSESTLYGQIQPGDGTLAPIDSISIPDTAGVPATYTWDVTAALNGLHGLAGANQTLSLFLRPEDITPTVLRGPHFFSKEADGIDAIPPRLLVEAIPVPEPATVWLMGIGVIGLLGRRS